MGRRFGVGIWGFGVLIVSSWLKEQKRQQALGRNRRVAGLLAAGMMAVTADVNAAAYDPSAPAPERVRAIENLHNAGVRDMKRHGVQMRGLKHYRPINLDGATLPQDQRETDLRISGNNINADRVNLTNARWTLDAHNMSMQSAGGFHSTLQGAANNLNISGFWGYGLHANLQAPNLVAENVMIYAGVLNVQAPNANISGAIGQTVTWDSDFSYGKFDVDAPGSDFSRTNFRGSEVSLADELQGRFTQANVSGVRANGFAALAMLASGADNTGDLDSVMGEKLDEKLNYTERAAQARQKVASRWAYQLTYRM